MDVETLQTLLRAGLSLLVTLGISALTLHMVRRPRHHRRHPQRRLLPWWVIAFAVLFLLIGSAVGVMGMVLLGEPDLSAEDLEDGRGMSLTGIGMVVFGLVLLWARIAVYLESTPDAFVFRGMLGRVTTIRYADLVEMHTTGERGAVRVTIVGRDRRKFTAALGMFDFAPFERWKQYEHERARDGAEEF